MGQRTVDDFMRYVLAIPLLLGLCGAARGQQATELVRAREADFGKMTDGAVVKLFTLRNAKGMSVKVMNYGGIITGVEAPDRDGKMVNVVLGAETFDLYLRGFNLQAQTIGRVANRIAGARFTLDGKEYQTEANNGPNTLHSGRANFGTKLWEGKILPAKANESSVQFTYVSKDGDGGFPGTLTAKVTFTLTDSNELRLDYEATSDKTTLVNLTNHAYFNLAGAGTGNILDHVLWIDADKYTVTDAGSMPTGEIAAVKDKPIDFTKPTAIGTRINQVGGRVPTYDHNYVLNSGGKRAADGSLPLAARVSDPKSGRIMEVRTDQPGVQLYTGNAQHPGLCLETQHYPDSIHHPEFPSIVLKAGESFKTTTVFAFSAK